MAGARKALPCVEGMDTRRAGAESGGWEGGWHFRSSSVGFARYRLGVTHAEKPWSQKELERIGGNLSVYFIS